MNSPRRWRVKVALLSTACAAVVAVTVGPSTATATHGTDCPYKHKAGDTWGQQTASAAPRRDKNEDGIVCRYFRDETLTNRFKDNVPTAED